MLLHDEARPHSARIMKEKIWDFGWCVLLHPPYLPDLGPNDIHLFRSQQIALNDNKFSHEDQVKTFVEKLLNPKPAEFYSGPDKLQDGIQNNGKYTIG